MGVYDQAGVQIAFTSGIVAPLLGSGCPLVEVARLVTDRVPL